MATPSWLRRLSESEDGRAFQIPSASLYSSTSSLGSHVSLPRHSSVSSENISERRSSLSQDTIDGMSSVSEKFTSKTVGRQRNGAHESRFTGPSKGYISGASTLSSNRYNTVNLDSGVASIYGTLEKPDRAVYSSRQMKDYEKSCTSGRCEANRDDSWSYVDSEGYAWLPPSIHTSVSCGEFGNSSFSSSSYVQGERKNNPNSPRSFDQSEEKKRAKRHDGHYDDTRASSGYNTYSELSDFGSTSRSFESRDNKTKPRNYSGDKERNDRYSKFPRRSSHSVEDRSADVSHKRCNSKLSVAESDVSGSSKERNKRTPERGSTTSLDSKTQKVPSIGNVAVTVTNNIQYDPNDPFSFIQPIDRPFHAKMRKCLGPVMAVLLLLILAAALGAAIYFGSALKDTQEKQIDMLRANLAMKIRNIDHIENIEELSSTDFKNLSTDYCKHMDLFYTRSQFGQTYRGCEVVSIKDSYINFTLFFVEEAATSSQIVEVIESAAMTVTGTSSQLAVVDKFALELDTVEVKMERKLEPETFNKKLIGAQTTTETPQRDKENVIERTTKKPTLDKKQLPQTPRPTTTTTVPPRSSRKKKPPADKPVYSWDPCTEYDGMYFPHPTQCDMFIQCTNGQIIEQRCTKGLLYHWKQLTCVSRFTRDVLCPDPSKAPPRPTTEAPTSSDRPSSLAPTTSTASQTTTQKAEFTTIYHSTTKQYIPDGIVLTAIAGKFAERPKYSANPCGNKIDVQLYPHPADCAMFIQCVNGEVQNMHCAKGLVFDPSNSACIFPTNNDLLCPDIRPCQGKDDGYFPHPFDCSKFIQCQFKKETVLKCQKGLVWSIKVNSCVHKTKTIVCPLDPKR